MAEWMVWALAATLANVAKLAIIRQYCRTIDSRWLVLAGRVFSAAALMPALLMSNQPFPDSGIFWTAALAAVMLTAAASVIYTDAVKHGPMMLVLPTQAAVPIFTLLTLWLCRSQIPPWRSIFLMIGAMVALGWMLYAQNRGQSLLKYHKNDLLRYPLMALFAAALFGISTALDRTAIAVVANGALVYSAYWHAISALLMVVETARCHRFAAASRLMPKMWITLVAFGIASLAAFFAQQWAVQKALAIAGSVVFIKAVVMLHLPLMMLLGAIFWHQRANGQAVIAGILALGLGIGLILSAT